VSKKTILNAAVLIFCKLAAVIVLNVAYNTAEEYRTHQNDEFRDIDEDILDSLQKSYSEETLFEHLKVEGYSFYYAPDFDELIKFISREGYGGEVDIKVIITAQKEIGQIIILEHSESPGLGDRIEEDSFLNQFIGKDVNNEFELGKDLDVLTGATVSAEAVALGAKKSLEKAGHVFDKIGL